MAVFPSVDDLHVSVINYHVIVRVFSRTFKSSLTDEDKRSSIVKATR